MGKEPVTREELAAALGKISQRIAALEAKPQAVTQSQTPSLSGSEDVPKKRRYVIYRGAMTGAYARRTGLVVVTDRLPNGDGLIVMPKDEYENSGDSTRPSDDFDDLYDVVTSKTHAVLYPRRFFSYPDPVIDVALGVVSHSQHPYGLCSDPTCASCVAQGQEIAHAIMGQAVPEARQSALNDLQTALTWAGGQALADRITGVAEAWIQAGRPAPQPEPALMTVVDG